MNSKEKNFITVFIQYIKKMKDKGLFHILGGSFLTKFVAMFGSIFIVRILSKTEYGALGHIENIYGYLYLFAGFGLNNAVFRYIVLGDNENEKASIYTYVMKKGLKYNLFLIVIGIIISLSFPHSIKYEHLSFFMVLYVLILPFQFMCETNTFTFRALFDNKTYAKLSLFLSVSLVLGRIFFSSLFKLAGTIIAMLVIYIVMSIVFKKELFSRFEFLKNEKMRLAKKKKKEMSIYSIQYMITNGIWALFMLNDIFLLGLFMNDAKMIADYKVAYTIPGSIAIVSSAIGIYVAPYFVKHESDRAWIRKNFLKVFIGNVIVMGTISVILMLLTEPIILLLYGNKYSNIVVLMRVLLFVAFLNAGMRYPIANILAAMGQIKYNMVISAIGVILQAIFDILLIPQYGVLGVAYAGIIVYLGMSVGLLTVFIFKYYVNRGEKL